MKGVELNVEWFAAQGFCNEGKVLGIGQLSSCGSAVGLHVCFLGDTTGGVMDYHEVSRLHAFLGGWLRQIENDGTYQKARNRWNEKLKEWKKQSQT